MNLKYFVQLFCEDCGSREELLNNKYHGNVKCSDCLNQLLKIEAELNEKHDDYSDLSEDGLQRHLNQ